MESESESEKGKQQKAKWDTLVKQDESNRRHIQKPSHNDSDTKMKKNWYV